MGSISPLPTADDMIGILTSENYPLLNGKIDITYILVAPPGYNIFIMVMDVNFPFEGDSLDFLEVG